MEEEMRLLHSPRPIVAYMRRHSLTQQEFAARIEKSQAAVSQWITGSRGMSIRTAEQIEEKTDGEIKVRALFPKFGRSA